MDDEERLICSIPDCPVPGGGKCIEGHIPSECPHYGREPEEDDEEEGERAVYAAPPPEGVPLSPAMAMAVQGAADILRHLESRVVGVLGTTEAGKTSLIASLYDAFQTGPVAEMLYARSHSLHAFEQACHDAREASQRNEPHIPRTPHGRVSFYHLDLRPLAGGPLLSLLLSDRAGEEYRALADDVTAGCDFPEVRRADILTVLVDGARLADAGARHNLRAELEFMLLAIHDCGAMPGGQKLALVLTKADVVASAGAERVRADFKRLEERLTERVGEKLAEVRSFEVAASPKSAVLPRGYGIPDLLKYWLGSLPPAPSHVDTQPTPPTGVGLLRSR